MIRTMSQLGGGGEEADEEAGGTHRQFTHACKEFTNACKAMSCSIVDQLRVRMAVNPSPGDVGILLAITNVPNLNGVTAECIRLLQNDRICVKTSDGQVLSVRRDSFTANCWEALLIDPNEKLISECKLYSVTKNAATAFCVEIMRIDPRMDISVFLPSNVAGLISSGNMPSSFMTAVARELVETSPQLQLYPHAAHLIGRSCVSMESCADDAVLIIADDLAYQGGGEPGFRLKANSARMPNRIYKGIFLHLNAPSCRPEIESCSWKHVRFGSVDDHDFSISRNIGMQAALILSQCEVCCRKHHKMWKCTNCKGVLYCSRRCQKLHWSLHKQNCISPSHRQGLVQGALGQNIKFN